MDDSSDLFSPSKVGLYLQSTHCPEAQELQARSIYFFSVSVAPRSGHGLGVGYFCLVLCEYVIKASHRLFHFSTEECWFLGSQVGVG